MIQRFGEESNHFEEIALRPISKIEKSTRKDLQWDNFIAKVGKSSLVKIENTKNVGKCEVVDPRQNRCNLDQKAKIIGYMNYRGTEEKKSNLSWFAEHIGVSRPTIYNIYNDFKERFQNETPPGPKLTPTEKIVEGLQKKLREKQEEFEILEQLVEEQEKQAEEEKKQRIVKTLLQAAVSPVSARDIRDLLEVAFGIRLSKRKIKKLIVEYSNKAQEILEDMDLDEYVEIMAIDEVFAGRSPILTGVEVNSFAVLICERETRRTHQEWYRVLGPFPHLKLVISDRAKGIIKAVRICDEALQHPLFHQFDIFHFKRDVGKLVRRLEASAYRKIESEYKSEAELHKAKAEEQRSKILEQYQQHRERALEAIEIYDATAETLVKVYRSLEIFDEEGNLNDLSANLRRIEKEVRNLKKIEEWMPAKSKNRKDMKSVIRQLQDPHLLLYLIQLETRLLNILCLWKEQGTTRKETIKTLCECWCREKRDKNVLERKTSIKRLAVMLQVRRLQMELANFKDVHRQVWEALDAACKASSLVESFNSQIRIYQQVKKGLHKNFLYFVALKWNLTPFDGGKRKGKSPCQILGVPLKSYNWLDLLLSG